MTEPMIRYTPGSRCPVHGCRGYLHLRNSSQVGAFQVGYLCCSDCRHRPEANKVIRPADSIRRRTRKNRRRRA